MADLFSISRDELSERRRQLQRQRRWKVVQTTWRTIVVSGMAAGLLWGASLPIWVIRSPEQIQVEGNELLTPETIYSLLPITYPQSLLMLRPEAIARELEAKAPISDAIITRQLFPPMLTIWVQERKPVAIAYPSNLSLEAIPPEQREAARLAQTGLLDETGIWISMERYVNLDQSIELPSLIVIGMKPEYRQQWATLYQQVRQSPVLIQEIDWRDPANLILATELGVVYLGSYSDRLPAQLGILDQMRELPSQVDMSQVAYIDLRNPDNPLVQMLQPTNTLTWRRNP